MASRLCHLDTVKTDAQLERAATVAATLPKPDKAALLEARMAALSQENDTSEVRRYAALIGFIGLIAKRWYDDIVLDHAFRGLYVETRTKLTASHVAGLIQEMQTFDELERIAVLEGMAPQVAARIKKRAAVKSMAAHLRINALLPG